MLDVLDDLRDPDGVPEALEWEAGVYGYDNPLVDFVPGEVLAGLITEAGIIRPEETGNLADRLYGFGVPQPSTE